MKPTKKNAITLAITLFFNALAYSQVGIGTTSPSEILDVESSNATKTALDINCTGAGDPLIHFQISGTAAFTVGVDNSDADKFKIGTTAVETSTALTIDASQNVGIGITAPLSTLDVSGSLGLKVTSLSSATTLSAAHNVVLASDAGGSFTITLPAAASNAARTYYIKKTNSSSDIITIDGNGAETIDGATTLVLYIQNDACRIVCDGSAWYVLEQHFTPHSAFMSNTADQTIPNTTNTKLAFDNETYDYGNIADYTTNDRIDIKRAGRYLIVGSLRTNAVLDLGEGASIDIKINNSTSPMNAWFESAASDQNVFVTGSIILNLAAGDYIEMYSWQNEGGDVTTGSGSNAYEDQTLMVTELLH